MDLVFNLKIHSIAPQEEIRLQCFFLQIFLFYLIEKFVTDATKLRENANHKSNILTLNLYYICGLTYIEQWLKP